MKVLSLSSISASLTPIKETRHIKSLLLLALLQLALLHFLALSATPYVMAHYVIKIFFTFGLVMVVSH